MLKRSSCFFWVIGIIVYLYKMFPYTSLKNISILLLITLAPDYPNVTLILRSGVSLKRAWFVPCCGIVMERFFINYLRRMSGQKLEIFKNSIMPWSGKKKKSLILSTNFLMQGIHYCRRIVCLSFALLKRKLIGRQNGISNSHYKFLNSVSISLIYLSIKSKESKL